MEELTEENMKKMMEIEEDRRKKGEMWEQKGEFVGMYISLEGNKGITIVDTEDASRILQWINAYNEFIKTVKVIPVLDRTEWMEALK